MYSYQNNPSPAPNPPDMLQTAASIQRFTPPTGFANQPCRFPSRPYRRIRKALPTMVWRSCAVISGKHNCCRDRRRAALHYASRGPMRNQFIFYPVGSCTTNQSAPIPNRNPQRGSKATALGNFCRLHPSFQRTISDGLVLSKNM